MMSEPTPEKLEVCAAQTTEFCKRRKGLAKPQDGFVATLWEPGGASIIFLCDECAATIKARRKLA